MSVSKLLCVLFFLMTIICFGQTQTSKDTLVAFKYYKKADSLFKVRKFDKSIELFKLALPIYQKAKVLDRVASCYNKISENQWRTQVDLEKSLKNAKRALNIYIKKDHPEKANSYDNIGNYYLFKSDYLIALSYFQKALDSRKKIFPEYHQDIAESYSNLGILFYHIRNHKKSVLYNKKALTIYKKIFGDKHLKIAKVYNNLGVTYSELEEYDTALSFYKKDLEITIENKGKHDLYVAFSYLNIGEIYYSLEQLDSTQEYYEKAVPILKKEKHTKGLFGLYNNIGSVLLKKGEKNKALQYYKKALNLAQKKYRNSRYETALTYRNIAMVYESFNNEKSLFYYTKVLHAYKEIFGENHIELAFIYVDLGNHYLNKNEFDKALAYHNKALKICKRTLDENHTAIAQSYLNIGSIYGMKKSYSEALSYYQKSLNILKNSPKKGLNLLLVCYHNIGETYKRQRRYKESLIAFNKAIELNIKNKNIEISKSSFTPNNYLDLNRLFEILIGKAKTLEASYKKDKTIYNLDESIVLYQNLDKLVDHLRQSYLNYKDKVNLVEQVKDMYSGAVSVHLLKFKVDNDTVALKKAYYYAEKSKSTVLKGLLQEQKVKNYSLKLPKKLITLESTLKSNRAYYQSRIVSEKSKDSVNDVIIQKYEDKLFDINQRQDSLLKVVKRYYPKYYKLRHNDKVVSISEIQEKIDKNTSVLEFFTTDSLTHAFVITKEDFTIKTLNTSKLSKKVEEFRNAILSENIAAYKFSANDLYHILIKPIKNTLKGDELIIIPDGVLWHLNFDLLLTQKDISGIPNSLPYLLKDYAISYANSATLLFNPFEEQKQDIQQKECLAFSFSDSINVVKTKNMSLNALRDVGEDLPGTRKEIRAIADIIDGQYYFGADANESNFKKHASKYKILHLALHGDVDNEEPQNSKLYFTKSNDTIEDNFLYGHELFALDIPSELAVLSACNTGTGKIAKGEGIMSMGHAFQYAGTKSLLLSSWEVSDKTTPKFMTYFYTNLKDGMTKSKALQQAKLQYLEQADFHKAAPFYWGGFYLVGDTAPIDFGINPLWYWGIGVVSSLLLFSVFLYKKKKISISKK